MMFKKNSAVLAFALALPLAMPVALSSVSVTHAAGESEDATTNAKNKDKTPKCFFGKIWDEKEEKCIKEEKSSSLDQDSIYHYGRDLAKLGQYENAIRVLYLAADQQDPRVLNYLGYSHRKLGKMDEALQYYHAAVAQNPDFSLVREYLGEAYIQLGQLEKARQQLSEIERICGNTACREYAMLADLMIDAQTQ